MVCSWYIVIQKTHYKYLKLWGGLEVEVTPHISDRAMEYPTNHKCHN